MYHEKAILNLAGVAAMITAITTFFLWLLPKFYSAPSTVEENIALVQNPFYVSRQWINFMHIPLALFAYYGLAYKLRKREKPIVTLGFVWFLIWGIIEMIGVSGIIFAVNRTWRANYAITDEHTKSILIQHIEMYSTLWDSMFFVLLIAFLFATAFFGWATWNGKGLEKILSFLFWLAVPLTVIIILSNYFGFDCGNKLTSIIYPILQPINRLILGLFLLKKIPFKNIGS